MENKADKNEDTARCGEKNLLAAVTVGSISIVASAPPDGVHAGSGHRRDDVFFCNTACVISDGHPTAQHIERQSVAAANYWSDGLSQDGNFLGAIETVHLVSASSAKLWRGSNIERGSAARVRAVFMRVIGMMMVIMHHS